MWATAQGFKGKKSTSSGQMELAKTGKKVMVCSRCSNMHHSPTSVRRAFQPLPVSHPSHLLFESDRPDTLKLQSFHPVCFEFLFRVYWIDAL